MELLLIIAIIGMLASIMLASISGSRKKARSAAIRQEMHQMASDFELGRLASGAYADISAGTGGCAGDCAQSVALNTTGPNYANLSAIAAQVEKDSGQTLRSAGFSICASGGSAPSAYAIYVADPASSGYLCLDSSGGTRIYQSLPGNYGPGGTCPPYQCQ